MMKLYICETDIFTTIHSTRAKAVTALKEFNARYGVTKAEARRKGTGYVLNRLIKDSIFVVTISEGTFGSYDDGVKSRGYVTLCVPKREMVKSYR